MHIPDGFIDAGTSVAAGVVAAGCVAVSLRGARELDDGRAPLAGLVAAFIFAVQMLNFPVAGGTSGHLLGGGAGRGARRPLGRGPVRLRRPLVQALLFADGGLTALGVNITNMAHRRRPWSATWSSSACAGAAGPPLVGGRGVRGRRRAVGSVLAAVAFTVEYAIGGNGAASVGTVAGGHGRRARPHRHRRGGHHRADGRRSWPPGPTWCTAPRPRTSLQRRAQRPLGGPPSAGLP